MSPRIAIASLVFTLLLAVVTFFALTPRQAPQQVLTDAVATLDTTTIREVSVTPAGAREPSTTITRDDALDVWLLRENGRVWPAGDAQVRGLLRLVSQLTRQPVDSATTAPSGATVVKLKRDGEAIVLHIAPTAVGGRVAVFEEGSKITRLAEAGLATLFTRDSLAAWRSQQPVATLSGQPARVVVDASGRRLELARLQERWTLTTPVVAPAERARVDALLQGVARLTATRILDDATTRENTGLDSPTAVVRVVTNVPAPVAGGAARVIEQELTLGAASDASGNAFFASVIAKDGSSVLWGPQIMTVSRDAMTSLVADSTSYIALRATQVPAPDVGSILLARCDSCVTAAKLEPVTKPAANDAILTRREQGWNMTRGTASAQAASSVQAAFAISTLRQLCETPADKVLTSAPAGVTSVATITLRSIAGAPLDVVAVGEIADAGTDAQGKKVSGVVVRSGTVYRLFMNDEARQMAKVLGEIVPVEG
ncbi:MAG TPA: DUF4340 domain-containing protein [Phycisphaerales bacterium]|nr:DUF4340 domain-containing protein [Phycisphaerales bacterium]